MAEDIKKEAVAETTPKETKVEKKKESKPKKQKKMRTYQQRQKRTGYMFMAPWIVGFAAFTLFPFLFTIYLSFTNVRHSLETQNFYLHCLII